MAQKAAKPVALTDALPRNLAASLGRMIASHSLLELRLSQTLYRLAGVSSPVGRIAVGNPRGADVLDRMQQLAQIAKIDLSRFPWKTFRAILEDLKKKRDWFAHGPWAHDHARDKYFVYVATGNRPKQPNAPARSRRIDPEGMATTPQDLRILNKQITGAIKQAETLDRLVQIMLGIRDGLKTRRPAGT